MSSWQHSFHQVSDCSECKASVLQLPLTTSSPTKVPSMDLSLGSEYHSGVGSHKQDVPPFSTYTQLRSHTEKLPQDTGRDLGPTNLTKLWELFISGFRTSTPKHIDSKRGALDEDPFLCHGTKAKPELLCIGEKMKKKAELR